MDLDEEELKKTRELNGADASVEDKIEAVVNKFNETCKELAKLSGMKHIAIIGYVDIADKHGFISSTEGLQSLESTTTFLLDFASMNIREAVKKTAIKNIDELKQAINKEENNNDK